MTRKQIRLISTLIFLLIGAYLYYVQPTATQTASKSAESSQPGLYQVTQFVDGDTIAVNMNGHTEKVRFIGVDTPETHKPNTPIQCYGPQAAAYTKSSIGTQKVRLVSDPKNTDRDRYNRLLRYVYLQDGTNLDEKLISEGYAFYYPYFPFSKSDEFALAQQMAINQHKGLWAACQPKPTDGGGWISNPA